MYEDVTLEIGELPSSASSAPRAAESGPFRIRVRGLGATADGRFTVPRLPPTDQGRLEEIGWKLFEAVFADPEPRDLFNACRNRVEGLNTNVEPGDETILRIRLVLYLEDAAFAAVNALPWELLSPPNRESFVLSRSTPLVRAPSLGEPVRRRRLPDRLRVLAVMPDPEDPSLGSLDLDSEWNNLREACAERGRVELERLDTKTTGRPTTRRALRGALRDAHRRGRPFDVVHFMGHGAFSAERNQGWLVFENEKGAAEYVSGDELAREMESFLPRLAVLNACDSAAAFGYLGGVAHRLLMKGLPAVVGMQRRISDPAAITFATELYRALAAGDPVDAAMTEARLGIDRQQGPWWVPVLFLRHTDGSLYDVHRRSLVASLETETAQWKRQVEELRRLLAQHTDMPANSVRVAGSPDESQVRIDLPESIARELLSSWRRRDSPLIQAPIKSLERPWKSRLAEAAPCVGLALAAGIWDGILEPWMDQMRDGISIVPPGEPALSLLYYVTIGALVLLAWALQRRFLPSSHRWEPRFWLAGLVLVLVLGLGLRPPPGVKASMYLEGRLETGSESYAYLFVRPIEDATCWLQSPIPLMVDPEGRWRARASFGGSPGQQYEVIVLVSEEPQHPEPFSVSDAYTCDLLSSRARRTVRLMEKR